MNWTQSEVTAILAAFVIGGFLTGAYVLWQQGKDLGWMYDENSRLWERVLELEDRTEHLEKRAVQIVDWLWQSSGHKRPDEGVPTEEHPAVVDDEPDDDGPATDIAHAADTQARKWSLLHKRADPETVITEGRHRPEAGGRSVHELIAEAGHEPMRAERAKKALPHGG